MKLLDSSLFCFLGSPFNNEGGVQRYPQGDLCDEVEKPAHGTETCPAQVVHQNSSISGKTC